jgi:hypothetical protein
MLERLFQNGFLTAEDAKDAEEDPENISSLRTIASCTVGSETPS